MSETPTYVRGDKYAMVPAWVLYADVSAGAIRLYAVLARRATASGYCYPGHAKLAEEAKCSVSSVKRYVDELAGIGAVRVKNRGRAADKQYESNEYWLMPSPMVIAEITGGVGPPVTLPRAADDPGVGPPVSYERDPLNETLPSGYSSEQEDNSGERAIGEVKNGKLYV